MTAATTSEALGLWLRCSSVERAREWLSTRAAFLNPKRTHAAGDLPAVCIIAQNSAWGGVERHTRALVRGLLRRGMQVKYVTGRGHVDQPEPALLNDPRFEWLPLPLDINAPGNRRTWTRTLRSVRGHAALLACPCVETGSLAFLGALRRSFRHVVYLEHLTPTPLPWQGEGLAATPTSWDDARRQVELLRRRYRMRCADRVVAVSEAVASGLRDAWLAEPGHVAVAHNGVPCVADSGPTHRRAARQGLGIDADATVFGMVNTSTRTTASTGCSTPRGSTKRKRGTAPSPAASSATWSTPSSTSAGCGRRTTSSLLTAPAAPSRPATASRRRQRPAPSPSA